LSRADFIVWFHICLPTAKVVRSTGPASREVALVQLTSRPSTAAA